MKKKKPAGHKEVFRKNMRILWVTDPWETLDHSNDTTLRIVEECLKLGAQCFWTEPKHITLDDKRTRILAREFRGFDEGRTAEGTKLSEPSLYGIGDFQQIYYRTDPPVDLKYLHPLILLHRAIPFGRPEVQAPLEVLLSSSEKIVPQELEAFAPATRVATRFEDFEVFGKKTLKTIAKPLHAAQSIDVVRLDWKTPADLQKARETLSRLTDGFTRPALLQEFLPEISDGEVRLWYLDGRFLASVRKKPAAGSVIINMDQGGTLAPHSSNEKEKKASLAIGRWLAKNKIRMAAVDLIAGKITDINYTSPGLIVGMEKTLGRPLAPEIARTICSSK
jgi:glutathione synthase